MVVVCVCVRARVRACVCVKHKAPVNGVAKVHTQN
jgi:hypothetical protein